jgi:hypothetical protein
MYTQPLHFSNQILMKTRFHSLLLFFIPPLLIAAILGLKHTTAQMQRDSIVAGEFALTNNGLPATRSVYYSVLHIPNSHIIDIRLRAKDTFDAAVAIWDNKGNHITWQPNTANSIYDGQIDISALSGDDYSIYFFDEDGSTATNLFLK